MSEGVAQLPLHQLRIVLGGSDRAHQPEITCFSARRGELCRQECPGEVQTDYWQLMVHPAGVCPRQARHAFELSQGLSGPPAQQLWQSTVHYFTANSKLLLL